MFDLSGAEIEMPPFSWTFHAPNGSPRPQPEPANAVAVNVGGHVFQTTRQTLSLAGPKSLLSRIPGGGGHFIDRDPELFSVLLSLLRTGNLPSRARAFDLDSLIAESRFYGVEPLLISSLSNPATFDAFALDKSLVLPLNGQDSPTAIAATPCGSLHVANGSKITSFDWSLRRKSTVLTQFSAVDSLLAISSSLAAAGATDFSGLQILELKNGRVRETLNWENATRSSSTVQAIGASPDYLFTSFESGRRNSNSIMVYDFGTFRPVQEIARCEIFGAELLSAIPATKLKWVSGYNLLMASGSHCGLSGMLGNIKFWDIRSGSVAWELKDGTDCFSDVTVSDNLSAMFKVGVNSGEVFFADLRYLGGENLWVCLQDNPKLLNGKKEGAGCRIEAHGNQVFCSKGRDIELWSEVVMNCSKGSFDGLPERVFRRNFVGRIKDVGGDRVTNLAFGGNKMFVTRKNQQLIEVWQSSARAF